MFYQTLGGWLYQGRRALEVVNEENVEEYELTMLHVCAKLLGVPSGDVILVYTDFGPDGPVSGAARRGLQTATRCFINFWSRFWVWILGRGVLCVSAVGGGGRCTMAAWKIRLCD